MSTTTKIKPGHFKNVFKPTSESTDATRTWAATMFGDAPVTVKLCERDCNNKFKARNRRDDDGRVFRRAFHITVKAGEQITIHLYSKATAADIKRAQRLIQRTRDGRLVDLWDEATSWAGYKMIAFLGIDPEEYSPEIRPCSNPGCIKDWHTWETRGDEYPEEPCMQDKIYTDWYRIYLQQHPGEPWEVHSFSLEEDGDEFTGAAGLERLRRWTTDFDYLQQECDRLNKEAGS